MSKSVKQYSSGDAIKTIYVNLVSDLERNAKIRLAMDKALLLLQDVKSFREERWPHVNQAPVYIHKCLVQCRDFLKRFRFKDDAFTDEELEDQALDKFLRIQSSIGGRPVDFHDPLLFMVLKKARLIVREILGEYSRDEHISCCRVGRNATVGNPKLFSYLDVKSMESPVTGSSEMLKWLKSVKDEPSFVGSPLSDLLSRGKPAQVVSELAISFVDKSYKALRSVIVNTWVGAFFTKGLGVMLENRLANARLPNGKSARLNIRYNAKRHGYLAKSGSVRGHNVTLDLSSASDLFTTALIMKLVPRKWFNALRLGRISQITHKDHHYHMVSFMTMGNGYTFPLQTILFYSLIRACSELSGISGTISVYGDDCIFPVKLWPYIRVIFGKLNFKINFEKTFYHGNFRESCGSDYYHGKNVRPYSFEGSDENLDPINYAAFLYQIYNGLLTRWDEAELPQTRSWILNEITRATGVILQVPPHYPDYSGIRVEKIKVDLWVRWAPVKRVWSAKLWRSKHLFTSITVHSDKRFIFHQLPYYVESLTGDEPDPLYGAERESLAWCEILPPRLKKRAKVDKEGWVVKTGPLYPYVSKKRIKPTLRTTPSSVLDWVEAPS